MCGIAGFWDPSRLAEKAELEQTARGMASALRHRGPDDEGTWADAPASLALGHRRLAILDLSREGHQPMLSADERYVLVFNGEVYNFAPLRSDLEQRGHLFRGRSDTEVMLAAFCQWGILPALQRFVGMFAFALWDRRTRRLHLARDRAGEKPLYYGWSDEAFVFGSELKALRAHPRWSTQINRGALALLTRYGYIPAPHSIYENIYKLPPGCLLTLTESHIRARQKPAAVPYWSAQTVAEAGAADPFTGTPEEAGDFLRDLLFQSVGRQMVADVPLGAFLSGGIDSSLVVALMQAQSHRPIRTFSIGFQQEKFNEAPFAKAVAGHLGTDHAELYVQDSDLQQVVPSLPIIYDEPLADPSQIPTVLLCRLAGANVKVSLSGDAGDELFGGYDHYRKARRIWRAIGRIPGPARQRLARALKSFSDAGLDLTAGLARGRHVFNRLLNLADVLPASSDRSLYNLLMSPNRNPQVWLREADEPQTQFELTSLWENLPDPLQRMTCLDFVTYLPDDILVKVDRAAMSVSLETRVPLLDHRIYEFACRLPASLKQKRGEGKWLLRQILHQYVPPALVDRPKSGFAAPIGAWLQGPMREWAEHLLGETRLRQEAFFDCREVRRKWGEHLSQKRDWSPGLWHVLMFQAWLEQQGPIRPRSKTGTLLIPEVSGRFNECQLATVGISPPKREQCGQRCESLERGLDPNSLVPASLHRASTDSGLSDGPRAGSRAVLLKRAGVAAEVTLGLGLALLTMNLMATWMYNLPSAPNPMFGDVHEPGRRFRQQIEGNGSGVFTSNCVRRASLPAAGQGPVLMVLGNSYTETTQVKDQDHFAHLLEQRLGDIPVLAASIVSNLGMLGYFKYCNFFIENFRMPYLSSNIAEFWRRWHMTLSAWLRDYLYIPLGGNRRGTLLTYRNLFLTMLLGGLWHGAKWNFVFWGGMHGVALASHRLWRKYFSHRWSMPAPLGWLLTLLFVMICWVPFRSVSFGDTLLLLKALAGAGAGHYEWLPVWLLWCLGLCFMGHLLGWWIEKRAGAARLEKPALRETVQEAGIPAASVGETRAEPARTEAWARLRLRDKLLGWLGIEIEAHQLSGAWLVPGNVSLAGAFVGALVMLVILFFAPLDDNPFIYFQF